MEQSQPRPEEPSRITKVVMRDGRPVHASEAPAPVRETIIDHEAKLKQRASEVLPGHEGGPEVTHIDAYYERLGLTVKPAKVLSPEEFVYYRDELARGGFRSSRLDGLGEINAYGGTDKAIYLPQLGLTVAVRLPEHHEGPGVVGFRHILAHEKAHTTSQYQQLAYTYDPQHGIHYGTPRVGHNLDVPSEGSFFEEGFAEYMAARYVRTELGLPNGSWESSALLSVDENEPVPPVYVLPVHQQEGAFMPVGALAAYGLELIVQKEPALESALIMARTSVEGLRRVAQIMEVVRPGLYVELRRLGENPGDFGKGLRTIQAALAGSSQ